MPFCSFRSFVDVSSVLISRIEIIWDAIIESPSLAKMDKVRSVSVSMSSCTIYLNPEDFPDGKMERVLVWLRTKKLQPLDVLCHLV